jgi:hypothetical protein
MDTRDLDFFKELVLVSLQKVWFRQINSLEQIL